MFVSLAGQLSLRRPDSPSALPPLHDHFPRTLVTPRLGTQGRKAPRRLRMVALDATFTTSVRMVHRVHGHAPDSGTLALPARAPGLAVSHVLVVEITDLTDGGHAIHRKLAHLTRGQLHKGEIPFLAQQLRRPAGRTNDLATAAGIELQVVHHRTRRNVAERHGVAGKNVGALTGLHGHSDLEPDGVKDVAL